MSIFPLKFLIQLTSKLKGLAGIFETYYLSNPKSVFHKYFGISTSTDVFVFVYSDIVKNRLDFEFRLLSEKQLAFNIVNTYGKIKYRKQWGNICFTPSICEKWKHANWDASI